MCFYLIKTCYLDVSGVNIIRIRIVWKFFQYHPICIVCRIPALISILAQLNSEIFSLVKHVETVYVHAMRFPYRFFDLFCGNIPYLDGLVWPLGSIFLAI